MKHYSYCINCGKVGHLNYMCKLPIISIGLVAFTQTAQGFKYLLINRKDSLGYVDFMRGKYSFDNIDQLMNMIEEMSIEERERLLSETFDELWLKLWNIESTSKYRTEEHISKEKFIKLKAGITVKNESISLKGLIDNCKNSWNEPEWGFPKGRRDTNEKDIECGIREFCEETGYASSSIVLIQNILTFDEIFIGSNYKSYKHKYFLAFIPENKLPDRPFQDTEVRDMRWMTYQEAIDNIRPYNLEKRDVLHKINNVLTSYRICC